MIVKVRRIGIFSAFKIGCGMYAVFVIVTFVIILLGALVAAAGILPRQQLSQFGAMSMGSLLVALPLGFVGGLLAGVVLALQAFIYNIVARFTGGFQIVLHRQAAREIDLSAPRTGTVAVPRAPRAPLPDVMPAQGSGIGTDARDEISAINKQIKERQRRIAELNDSILKKQ